jgi:hypothetical protein
LDIALHNRYTPARRKIILHENCEHRLVPEVFGFGGSFLQLFLIAECEVHVVAEIKIPLNYTLSELFQDFVVFLLVDRIVEELVLERNEIYIGYAEDIALIERGHCLCLLYYAQIWLLVDY